jgi:hypothetical protein
MKHTHDRGCNPHDQHKSAEDIEGCPEWCHEWGANVCDLCPVKCYRKQAQSGGYSKLVQSVRPCFEIIVQLTRLATMTFFGANQVMTLK